jgi:hypothetical protein
MNIKEKIRNYADSTITNPMHILDYIFEYDAPGNVYVYDNCIYYFFKSETTYSNNKILLFRISSTNILSKRYKVLNLKEVKEELSTLSELERKFQRR